MNKHPDDYYRTDRPEIVPFLPDQYTRVLEIGCGEGPFSNHLRKDCERWGCELSEEAARRATEKRGEGQILVGRYSQVAYEIPADYFDLVMCNDVIEHMEDHDWFFDSIREKMRRGGCPVGSIPNIRHIRALYKLLVLKDWPYQDFLTFDRTHLRWFTRKSLLRTFREHHFAVEKFGGINGTKNVFFMILLRVFNFVTLGFHSDIQYLQFAFRIRKV